MLDVRPTPNPNAVKVHLARPAVKGSLVVTKPDDAKGHALAGALIGIEGVKDLFFLNDFVTVSRHAGVAWDAILPKVEAAIAAHLR